MTLTLHSKFESADRRVFSRNHPDVYSALRSQRRETGSLGRFEVSQRDKPKTLSLAMSKNRETLAAPDEGEEDRRAPPPPSLRAAAAEQQVHRGPVPEHLRAAQRAQEADIAARYQKNLEESLKAGVAPDPNLKPHWIR
jgi:hypothetical protein